MCLGFSQRSLRLRYFTVLTYGFTSETSLNTSTTETTCDPAHYLLTYLLTYLLNYLLTYSMEQKPS